MGAIKCEQCLSMSVPKEQGNGLLKKKKKRLQVSTPAPMIAALTTLEYEGVTDTQIITL